MVRSVLHVGAAGSGLLLLYVAFFLDESEEGRLENGLETLWRHIEAAQTSALSRQAAFLHEIARWTSAGLNRIFGEKLIGSQALIVSFCYSMSSLYLVTFLFDIYEPKAIEEYVVVLLAFVFWAGVGTVPAVWPNHRWIPSIAVALTTLITIGFLIAQWPDFGPNVVGPNLYDPPWHLFVRGTAPLLDIVVSVEDSQWWDAPLVGLLGVVSDIVAIAAVRALLRWVPRMDAFAPALGVLLGTAAIPMGLVVLPACVRFEIIGRHLDEGLLLLIVGIGATNVFSAVGCLLWTVLALSAMAHRVAWPLIRRPVMAAHRHGLLKQRKLLFGVGVGLLSWSTPVGRQVEEFLRHVHISFS